MPPGSQLVLTPTLALPFLRWDPISAQKANPNGNCLDAYSVQWYWLVLGGLACKCLVKTLNAHYPKPQAELGCPPHRFSPNPLKDIVLGKKTTQKYSLKSRAKESSCCPGWCSHSDPSVKPVFHLPGLFKVCTRFCTNWFSDYTNWRPGRGWA